MINACYALFIRFRSHLAELVRSWADVPDASNMYGCLGILDLSFLDDCTLRFTGDDRSRPASVLCAKAPVPTGLDEHFVLRHPIDPFRVVADNTPAFQSVGGNPPMP